MNHTPVHLRESWETEAKRSSLTPPRNRRPSFLGAVVIQERGAGTQPSFAGPMRAALVLVSLGSVAAFGGAKVIAGCLDPLATNYNTPGPVTLSVPGMCQYNPAPPAPPSAPGRYGRASTLEFEPASNPNPPAHARSLLTPSTGLRYRRARESAATITTTARAAVARPAIQAVFRGARSTSAASVRAFGRTLLA